jgi:hypothetical protein
MRNCPPNKSYRWDDPTVVTWGPFTCDLFAETNNHKTNLFFSPNWCPGSGGGDALGFNWSGHNCWIVPPVRLIWRTISHLALCIGHSILMREEHKFDSSKI